MATDDFLLDEVERSQRHQTRRRREGRSQRRRIFLLIGLAVLGLLVLGAPSFLSHSPMGRSMVAHAAADYGLDAQVDSLSVGWFTPLRISGVQLRGKSAGSDIAIEQIETSLTVRDLLTRKTSSFGEVLVRGLNIRCAVSNGRCSLEDDLQALLEPSEPSSDPAIGLIEIQDLAMTATDTITGSTWQLSQSNATVDLNDNQLAAKFSGVLTEPRGGGGALQGSMQWISPPNASRSQPSNPQTGPTPVSDWKMTLDTDSLPLSVVSLLHRRFPNESASLPQDISGDATGAISAVGRSDGSIEASLQNFQIRNLHATEPTAPNIAANQAAAHGRVWTNKLATFHGDVTLVGDRVIGRGLTAQADFASATLDGAFSRSITLVGANNNPLRWLEALDGTAQADIDLAAMDQAMPGLLPLRSETQLISGRATARINSLPSRQGRRSQLTLKSDAVRARARGQAVVLEPIEINATVLDENGKVHAETFKLTSSFASAVGDGDMQDGRADFQIDFGRLSDMLRPIVDMSQTALAGSANGNIRWNASNQNVWRLKGNANGSNLLVTLPSGQSVKRNSLSATVEAVGRWGGQSLDELTQAKLSVKGTDLNLDAELTRPVPQPSTTTPLPIRLDGNGRVETLAETLMPWLPTDLHDAAGYFDLHSRGECSTIAARLQNATLELTDPKIGYGDRWFSQPKVKVHFDGDYQWPSGDFESRSLTVAGDAVSMALKGQASADNIDLEVAWKAKLERIQGSVRKRAQQWPANRTQTVSFRSNPTRGGDQSEEWLVRGDCEGNFTVRSKQDVLEIQSKSSGSNIAIVQPPDASAQSYTVGPMPRSSNRFNGQNPTFGSMAPRVVWAEPNLRINGLTRYDQQTGKINADAMQFSGDWFATTLTGHAIWNETVGDVVLRGPAKLKMDEISRRLTTLSGTAIDVEGIQETPLEIHAARNAAGDVAFTVQGNLGWDLGEIAGVQFGPATVPVRLTETTVEISPSTVPVGQGEVTLAGEVFYRPGPIWLRTRPGTVARNLRLTPDMTNRWLKYLAPLAADAARIDGTMSVELDEAIVVVDTPEHSRVKGRINIDSAQMTAGPLAAQIIGGIDQLKSLTRLTPAEARNNTTLLTMPPQTIDFALDHGIVRHQRLFFEIDRAQVMTSGEVSLDSQVNLVAQVELDERWLGGDLKGLAGQGVSLPITGTLSRPSLDPSGIRNVVTTLGTQAATNAIQETAENYLQKQLNRSIEKILGR
ncbi:MAG: hypothetical protein HKN47_03420 [Pirellulaceae bacterium]|nr:hypothetical protein [Pirellulaceae bacterium]